MTPPRVFNQLLETIAALTEYDTLVLIASDWRIRDDGDESSALRSSACRWGRRRSAPTYRSTCDELDRVLTTVLSARRGRATPGAEGRGARRGRRPVREVEAVKEVVSVSIGSSTRDHEVEIDLLGEQFRIRREGHDGDLEAAAARFAELDGTVDAFGMGGIDIYLRADGRKYFFRDAKKLIKGVHTTPVVDGSGLKGPVEGSTIDYLIERVRSGARRQEGADVLGGRPLGHDRGAAERRLPSRCSAT